MTEEKLKKIILCPELKIIINQKEGFILKDFLNHFQVCNECSDNIYDSIKEDKEVFKMLKGYALKSITKGGLF